MESFPVLALGMVLSMTQRWFTEDLFKGDFSSFITEYTYEYTVQCFMCIVLNINVIFETYGALIDPAAILEYFYFNCTRPHFDKQKRFSML